MSESVDFFRSLRLSQRVALGVGCLIIIATVAALGWWAMRMPKAVLFADLADKDAALIVGELDKLKQPYEISDNGQAILVSQDAVHKTRMTLMGRQLPLHGAVGFELFNNAEFGVSDFVQKVNFQRALQGELTRTILSVEQILSARVHLALPDQTLFRKDGPKSKASVTVVTKPGQTLQPAQVLGIQRLIAASVPEVKHEDVTVLDQHGVVLSLLAGEEAPATADQMDARLALEQHLSRKASQLLARMFKSGEALVTVDVVFNHQQTRVTTEEVLPGTPVQKDTTPAGVIVRERTVTREAGRTEAGATAGAPNVTTQEFDYLTGKRTEQVTSPAGHIARINVAVVVKAALTEAETARVKSVVGASVGFQANRGDVVAVYSMAERSLHSQDSAAALASPVVGGVETISPAQEATVKVLREGKPQIGADSSVVWGLAVTLVAAMLIALILWMKARRSGAVERQPRSLSETEREAMLRTIQQWLGPEQGRV